MPRRPRYVLPDGLFHVTGRAVFESPLFADDHDRRVFLVLLRRVIADFGIECIAYCLLGTHFHLLVRCARPDLSVAMHRLNGRYARHFNSRHARHGHVFGDRFSAYVIRDERHFEKTCAYIEANPVKAGLCRTVDEWPWTWIPYRRPPSSVASPHRARAAHLRRRPRGPRAHRAAPSAHRAHQLPRAGRAARHRGLGQAREPPAYRRLQGARRRQPRLATGR